MCCGQDEGPRLAAVTTEEPMAKVYTAVPGAVMSVGGYGIASNEQAAEVPESVADELAGHEGLVIVREGASRVLSFGVAPQPLTGSESVLPLDYAAGADFVIPEDNPPATPAKSATKARKE